jgi:TetR/AcrR family transcriptional regulator, cholesterol catabolism regulator
MAATKRIASESKVAAPAEESSTRGRIVDGARRHFFAHGFRGVTMDDLAAELGMSKKTLYAHFPSKTALLEHVLRDKLKRAEADLEQATSESDGRFADRLQRMLAAAKSQMEELQPPFVRDMRREAPELFSLVQEGRRKLIQRHFGKLLSEGRKAGTIRRDVSVNLLIEILTGAVDSVMTPQKLGELGLTPKTGFAQVITVFLEGITTKEGRGK